MGANVSFISIVGNDEASKFAESKLKETDSKSFNKLSEFEKRLARFISLVQIRVEGKEFNTSRVILSRSN